MHYWSRGRLVTWLELLPPIWEVVSSNPSRGYIPVSAQNLAWSYTSRSGPMVRLGDLHTLLSKCMGGRSVLSSVWQHASASRIRDGRAGSSQSCQKTELTMLGQKSLNCRHSSRSLTCKALPKGSSINEKTNALLRPRWLYTPFT